MVKVDVYVFVCVCVFVAFSGTGTSCSRASLPRVVFHIRTPSSFSSSL